MIKKIRLTALILLFCTILIIPAYADSARVYEINNCDVVVAIVNGHTGTIEEYADDMYDYSGFKNDGIILVIDTLYRECHISTKGSCIETFDNKAMSRIEQELLPYLRANDWDGAEARFVTLCKGYLYSGIRGIIYKVIASIGIGTVLSGTPLRKYKKEMENVKSKSSAEEYLKPGSTSLIGNSDVLLRTAVTKAPIPRVETTGPGGHNSGGGGVHVSSSGSTHGGHSFKF